MPRKFERTDPDSRGLKQCYRDFAEKLKERAATLSAEVHDQFYPAFGLIGGLRKRTLLRRFRGWEDMFKAQAAELFRFSRTVEENLIYTIAVDARPEHRQAYQAVTDRRAAVDRLLRAMSARIQIFRSAETLDTEILFDFCALVERASLYLQFSSQVLLNAAGGMAQPWRDGGFINLDWDEIDRWGRDLPEMFRDMPDRKSHAPEPRPSPFSSSRTTVEPDWATERPNVVDAESELVQPGMAALPAPTGVKRGGPARPRRARSFFGRWV